MPRIQEPDYSVKWMAANVAKELEREAVEAFTAATGDHAKLRAPYRSGRLQRSIVAKDGRVRATAPYALYVHQGTRPHIIRARRARVLSWVAGGVRHFARQVFHPGTKANPFIKLALEDTRREAPRILQQIMDRVLYRNRVR